MALADDPRAWILRLFEMEAREGRGQFCQRFPDGTVPHGLPLAPDEKVYGIYKAKYFFTPQSLLIRRPDGIDRVEWKSICGCSTQHGDGQKESTLMLTDGRTVNVRISDMATGWSGRISQLFHQMIERYGNRASVGSRLYSIEEFFAIAKDDHCLFPNLEPHPPLDELRGALDTLRNRPDVSDVSLITQVEDDGPVCDGVIVRTTASSSDFTDFVKRLGADGVIQASANELRQLSDLKPEEEVWHIAWD